MIRCNTNQVDLAATTLHCVCALYAEMPNSVMIKPDILILPADVEVRIKINAWVFVFNIVKKQSADRAPDPRSRTRWRCSPATG